MSASTYKDDTIKVCCTSGTPHASGDYAGQGSVVSIGNEGLRGYVTGNGPLGVIVGYDIFGFEIGNTRRFVDQLAGENSGLTVLMPDFYRGDAWSLENFPPKGGFGDISDWVAKVGTWAIVEKDLVTAKTFLEARGVTGKLGIVGFCWGGKQAIRACALSEYGAGISLHGAWLGPEDAEKVICPMMFLPAGDDPPIEPVEAVLKKKPFGNECVFHTFSDMQHGFAAARGDLEDANTLKCFNLANQMTKDFLLKHLK